MTRVVVGPWERVPFEAVPVDPFKKAYEYWKAKQALPSDVFEKLVDELKGQAFRLVDVWHQSFVEAVLASLEDAFRKGLTVREWSRNAQKLLDTYGASEAVRIYSGEKWSAWYADLVFRNAFSSSLMAGRYSAMFSGAWMNVAPYWMYDAINDSRVRDEHLWLDGKVFDKRDAIARRFLPPWDHNCRCSVIELDAKEVADGGYRITKGTQIPFRPRKGWNADRVASLVPGVLRGAA